MATDAERRDVISRLAVANETKIVLLVADGLGGVEPTPGTGTELEAAATPNLDGLASQGTLGLMTPVAPGITPGSGPGHLGLLGFDPMEVLVGRGVLEALGIGFELGPDDVAARCNFCTVDGEGRITDRRAGRLPSEEAAELVQKLEDVTVEGVEVFVDHIREHRFLLVLRGEGLGAEVADTDPQHEGLEPLGAEPLSDDSRRTAEVIDEFAAGAREALEGEDGNMILVRGVSKRPDIPSFRDAYHLKSLAVATYPMYRGLARLVGMEIADVATTEDQLAAVAESWGDYDFFFVHYKPTDSTGEDKRFDLKVQAIEALDSAVPALLSNEPDVVAVTADHSTPASLGSHSWHPVPVLLAAKSCRRDGTTAFGESQCRLGGLGHFESKHLLALMLAHGHRLDKFGA
ncbi:MAG: 2,3-bisphosphoglycerate-independent phosphoglycerate mutase [Actinomycetota bacterium]|nr:2,3-bisphosphoglycerate-independent phosphoglycerate mutase [Actinomycetota bacterium]